jgi:sugar-specific transcriptional regulator TrmB
MIELKGIMSPTEATAYLALLNSGASTATTAIKKTGMHRSSVYDALEKLARKGLVSYIMKNGVKHFEAANPEALQKYFSEKEKAVDELIDRLSAKHSAQQELKAEILEGYGALKKMMMQFIDTASKSRTEYLSYGTLPEFRDALAPWLEIHHKERIRKKVPTKIIFSRGAEHRAENAGSMQFASAKCLPAELNAPVTTEISGDEIMIIHWAEKPLIVHIESREIAESYRKHFGFLWGISKFIHS